MNFFGKIEKKLGRFAIRDLMKYVAALYVLGVMIQQVMPDVYIEYLSLDASKILRGEIWRLVTFIIWPPSGGILLNALLIYIYYNWGTTLERMWGSFKFNVYFLMGLLGHGLAAILIFLVTGERYLLTSEYLNFSLFFAIAATFPDTHFYLYMAIPIKAKWLALVDVAIYAYGAIFGGTAERIAIVVSLLNCILFFILSKGSRYSPKEIKRKHQFKSEISQVTREVKRMGRHHCAVCGRTDVDFPELEFRFCSKCEGDYEYCQDHLYTHQHVTRGGMDPRQASRPQPPIS